MSDRLDCVDFHEKFGTNNRANEMSRDVYGDGSENPPDVRGILREIDGEEVEQGDVLCGRLPICDTSDPADLATWYGNFGFAEHWRKVVLANCYEIQRAKNPKFSETRLKEIARLHDSYIVFLTTHLEGRRMYEREQIAARTAP